MSGKCHTMAAFHLVLLAFILKHGKVNTAFDRKVNVNRNDMTAL